MTGAISQAQAQQAEMKRQFEATGPQNWHRLQPSVPDRRGPNGEKIFDLPHESLSDPPFDDPRYQMQCAEQNCMICSTTEMNNAPSPSLSDIMSELRVLRSEVAQLKEDIRSGEAMAFTSD